MAQPSLHYVIEQCDEASIVTLANTIAPSLHIGDCIMLTGTLGAGKTTFARAVIQALCGAQCDVASPTFTVCQLYCASNGSPIYHYDLYRIEHVSELEETGIDEALEQGICLIEWPEIAKAHLPDDVLHIDVAFMCDADYRGVTITGGVSWTTRLPHLTLLSQ